MRLRIYKNGYIEVMRLERFEVHKDKVFAYEIRKERVFGITSKHKVEIIENGHVSLTINPFAQTVALYEAEVDDNATYKKGGETILKVAFQEWLNKNVDFREQLTLNSE